MFCLDIWVQNGIKYLSKLQEPDRQDVPSLLTNAKGVVEELASMKEEPDKDALEVDSEIATEVEQLSNMTKSELACKCHPQWLS